MGRTITVTEAARNFADLINRTRYRGETTLLVKAGEPVAVVGPVGGAIVNGGEFAARWRLMPHLDEKEASEFAEAVESAKRALPATTSPWD